MRALVAAVLVLVVATPAAAAPGPSSAPEYWFDDWQVSTLWDSGARGQGITIGEIDSGVNADVPELSGRILAGHDFGSAGGDGRTDRSRDKFGHGTAMASLMVAESGYLNIAGLAPDAKILPVAIPLVGTTDAGDGDYLPNAIRWAADHGAKVISMSLGSAAEQRPGATVCTADEQDAIFHALRKGAILFAAAGNGGVHADPEEPGVCLGVVSVGAVNRSDEVAEFSSRHPYVTMAAPGVNIPTLSRVPGSAYAGDGTSQATAIASAVAALVWSRYPKLSGGQVVARLLATLDHHRTARDAGYGYGVVDAATAVRADVPADAPNPVYEAAAPFMARQKALAPHPEPVVPPASVVATPPGRYAVGSPPKQGGSAGWGIGLAVVGGVALLVLAAVGLRGRRAIPAADASV